MKKNPPRSRSTGVVIAALLTGSITACGVLDDTLRSVPDAVIVSVVGTNDVHGQLLPGEQRGGLTTLSGYVSALRAAREADGGAVVLVDAGDMWQGTLESNLTEGAGVVAAYNTLGYAAAAIGNHEFDFGPQGGAATPQKAGDDPRGALKQRATETDFPLLAANLIDEATGAPVAWPNVRPSILLEAAGIPIGVIGVVTSNAFVTTIAANTGGLRIGSLSDAIVREAKELRAAGAALVVVVAHAGSRCSAFDDPTDLATCNLSGEILRVAQQIPAGLVDHIVAGHVHQGIAHVVNGIAVTSSYSNTYAFSRVDFRIDRSDGSVLERRIFPPQILCPMRDASGGECVWVTSSDDATRRPIYEGRQVHPDAAIGRIAARAAADARAIKEQPLGVFLETPFTLEGNPESPLGNLVTDALYESADVDIVFHNVSGGLRAILPQGELTYGSVYEMFPFDNRVVILEMSGADLRRIVGAQAPKQHRRTGFSGMRVFVTCNTGRMSVKMQLTDGREIMDDDRLRVLANDFLATGGDEILTPAMPDDGFRYADDARLIRDVIADWFRNRGGRLRAEQFQDEHTRWNLPAPLPADCSFG